jgi:hypothetical protein
LTVSPLLAGRRFRAGGAYDLVVFDRLPPEERAALAALAADPGFYGVLRPHEGSGLTAKSVNRDIALLWFTLQQPGTLPFFAEPTDPEAAAALWQLVLDSVLEAEADGHFVSGVHAASVLGAAPSGAAAVPARQGLLGERSRAALCYAEHSGIADFESLAARLYRFGTEPVTPAWRARLPDAAGVLAFLGAGAGSRLARRLDQHWEAAASETASGWLAWQRKDRIGGGNAAEPTHKLYVSPRIDALPAVFEAVVRHLPPGVHAFKVGNDAAGLLRPDKMVLYADGPDTLLAAAQALEPHLAGAPVHGVPFSSELGAGGLLSWGMDPPALGSHTPWLGAESWRLWLVRRLGAALAAALAATKAQSGMAMSAAAFALERLRQDGVDVDHWTPSLRLWRNA